MDNTMQTTTIIQQAPEELLNVAQVAEVLKTNKNFVYKLAKSGLVRFLKIGSLKCRRSTLEAFIIKYEGYDLTDLDNIQELNAEAEEGENGI